MLTASTATRWATIALGHVAREYPNKLDHVLHGPGDVASPRALHPIFYGSFDWHSCVHGYWLLATLHRTHLQSSALGVKTRALFDDAFTAEKVAGELDYLQHRAGETFERPYGWAWLLMLQAELTRSKYRPGWARALAPLASAIAVRLRIYLEKLTYPVRSGTHANTAFALILALEYAQTCRDEEMTEAVGAAALRWFAHDADHRPVEPSGEDFLSPTLVEAECMRRLLTPADFADWLDGFLPRLADFDPPALFEPVAVADRSDGRIVHLDGLNLSRAWCWRGLADGLEAGSGPRGAARAAAERHLAAGLPHLTGDYAGEHWLATFALLAIREG
jgi:hypothetical protein